MKVLETVLETEDAKVVIQDFPSQPLLRLVDVTNFATRNHTQFIVEKGLDVFVPFFCSSDAMRPPWEPAGGTHLAFLGTAFEEGGSYRRWSVTPINEAGELEGLALEYWESADEVRTRDVEYEF